MANCSINVPVNAQGVLVNALYTGTINQLAGITVTIGASGFIEHGGTWSGGNADITLNGGNFTLTGGSFTSTSGTLTIGGTRTASATLFSQVGGTFAHNNGTLHIKPYNNTGAQLTWTIDVLPATVFHNVEIDVNHAWTQPLLATAPGD
ncbi:MAG: hypothetical protein IT230_05665, partial [Flavobacteriales bacterium]|nr:hypothetical protein [Flavobacteriales bacterium]